MATGKSPYISSVRCAGWERASLPRAGLKFTIVYTQINNYIEKYSYVKAGLQGIISEMSPVAIYGCGARSSNFVNFLEINSIEFFIDDQIQKQNKFVPGSNLEIVQFKEKYKNMNILLGVNAENENAVIKKRNLNTKKIFSISPPSRYLLENQIS